MIGSANSSNTLALAKVARDAGCPIVLRVDGPDELDLDALGDATRRRRHRGRERARGSRAGGDRASSRPRDGVEPVHVTDEDEYFPPPRELRELLPALDALAAFVFGGDPQRARALGGPFLDDRALDASHVLSGLADS